MKQRFITIVASIGASLAGSSMVFLYENHYNSGAMITLAFGLSVTISGCISLLKKRA